MPVCASAQITRFGRYFTPSENEAYHELLGQRHNESFRIWFLGIITCAPHRKMGKNLN